MGGACTRCFGAEAQPREGGKAHRHRKRSHGKSASPHHAAPVPGAGRFSDGLGVPGALALPALGGAAGKAALSASQVAAGIGGGGATLLRSESGLDVFYDAREVFEDASALADAPFAFARHALCAEPPGDGHRACAAAAALDAAGSATPTAAALADGGEQGKTAEVEQLESLGQSFGEDFWSGKGSLAGRGLKALQALRHLKDVDLSRFTGVPISQHMQVSGSQVRRAAAIVLECAAMRGASSVAWRSKAFTHAARQLRGCAGTMPPRMLIRLRDAASDAAQE
jgi:hypothetical protein